MLFAPRQDTNSGQVTKASLYIQTEKDGKWVEVAKDKTFAADKSESIYVRQTNGIRIQVCCNSVK
ncbi:MAG: hypothetical protein ACLTCI_05490 [[Clostridium] nexile]